MPSCWRVRCRAMQAPCRLGWQPAAAAVACAGRSGCLPPHPPRPRPPRPAADADVAYTVKPLWASYLAFIQGADTDGAFMEDRAAGQDKPARERACLCRRACGSAACRPALLVPCSPLRAQHNSRGARGSDLLLRTFPLPSLSCTLSEHGPVCAAAHARRARLRQGLGGAGAQGAGGRQERPAGPGAAGGRRVPALRNHLPLHAKGVQRE